MLLQWPAVSTFNRWCGFSRPLTKLIHGSLLVAYEALKTLQKYGFFEYRLRLDCFEHVELFLSIDPLTMQRPEDGGLHYYALEIGRYLTP